jgi:hypothetical protein
MGTFLYRVPIPSAEDVSAETQVIQLKSKSSNDNAGLGGLAAKTLVEAMLAAAQTRQHNHSQTAKFLGITDVHWYRLRRRPSLLARSERRLLERVARYAEWPLLHVYVAAGILEWEDVAGALHSSRAVGDALGRLARSPVGAAVRTPLEDAANDHRMLIALLFLAVQASDVWKAMSDA